MAARPLWSGSISFGLVSIPVRMFAATQSQELRFHFVDRRDLMPVGYDKVRKDTGEHVDPDEIVRAFEVEKGHYVPLEPEVVVEPPGVVALDDEDRAAGATPAAERLGCLAGISLALVGLELRHLFHRYAGRV